MAEYIKSEFNPCTVCDYKRCSNCILHELAMKFVGHPAADVALVVCGPMRVEVTTDDFVNQELALNSGWYRKRYFCLSCGQKLKEETYEKEQCFASWDLVREECPLHHCPNCGARMDSAE